MKFKFDWNSIHRFSIIYAVDKKIKLSPSLIILLSGLAAGIVILGINYWSWNNNSITFDSTMNILLICFFVFIAAFFYEILALAILDRIGLEEKYSARSGMIIRTYGLMGIGAAISFWLFGITQSSFLGLLATLVVCLACASLAILQRKEFSQYVETIELKE